MARGLGREQIHEEAWGESYPHPLLSAMMPLLALLAMAAIGIFGFQAWQWSLPRDTTVPPVVGLPLEQAQQALESEKLRGEVNKERQVSEEVPEGFVISIDPSEGRRVKVGRVIHITLSDGTAYTHIPEVRQLPEETARERLRAAHLFITSEEYANDPTIPFGRVIAITPKPATRVKRNSVVSLIVSKGQEVTLPSDISAEMRSVVMTVDLPTESAEAAEVRIDVTDVDGTRTVYREVRQPGDTVIQTVQGVGSMKVEVYFGSHLIQTRKL